MLMNVNHFLGGYILKMQQSHLCHILSMYPNCKLAFEMNAISFHLSLFMFLIGPCRTMTQQGDEVHSGPSVDASRRWHGLFIFLLLQVPRAGFHEGLVCFPSVGNDQSFNLFNRPKSKLMVHVITVWVNNVDSGALVVPSWFVLDWMWQS